MELNAALRERNREDFDRVERASQNPNRRDFSDPLDSRLECPLGRIRVNKKITEEEYQAGVKWRTIHKAWKDSITHPEELTDEQCEQAQEAFRRGLKILEAHGNRVYHAVNAIVVYEEPEELGDFEFTSSAAKIGLAALASAL
jgi:hypothetical protein